MNPAATTIVSRLELFTSVRSCFRRAEVHPSRRSDGFGEIDERLWVDITFPRSSCCDWLASHRYVTILILYTLYPTYSRRHDAKKMSPPPPDCRMVQGYHGDLRCLVLLFRLADTSIGSDLLSPGEDKSVGKTWTE